MSGRSDRGRRGPTKLKEGPIQALPRGWTRHTSSGIGGMNSVAEKDNAAYSLVPTTHFLIAYFTYLSATYVF